MAKKANNAIVITTDCLRADHLSCYGYKEKISPHIDAFAESRLLYKRCLSAAPWTLPSNADMLTGRYSAEHGLMTHNDRISEDVPTLAEILKAEGFNTAAVVENKNLQESFGFSRGFDSYHNEYLHTVEDDPTNDTLDVRGTAGTGEGKDHNHVFDLVYEKLKEMQGQPERFFLWFHTNLIHDFYLDHPYYRGADNEERLFNSGVHHNTIKSEPFWRNLTPEGLRALINRYNNGISYADKKLKKILDKIDLSNTMVVLMSDHGESFNPDLKRFHHCGQLHNDVLHVPLIIHYPDESREIINNTRKLVSSIDICPTILDTLEVKTDADFTGSSLIREIPERKLKAHEEGYLYLWPFQNDLPEDLLNDEPENKKRGRLTYKSKVPFRIDSESGENGKLITTQIGGQKFNEWYDIQKDWNESENARPVLIDHPAMILGSHEGRPIIVGFDRNAERVKEEVVKYLREAFTEVISLNEKRNTPYGSYVDVANDALKGRDLYQNIVMLFCGNGMGMSIAANKFPDANAARCTSTEDAIKSREVNNANVLCLGANLSPDMIKDIIDHWIKTPYKGRKIENLRKIIDIK